MQFISSLTHGVPELCGNVLDNSVIIINQVLKGSMRLKENPALNKIFLSGINALKPRNMRILLAIHTIYAIRHKVAASTTISR